MITTLVACHQIDQLTEIAPDCRPCILPTEQCDIRHGASSSVVIVNL